MNNKYLYIAAALIWGIPGVIIAIKGIKAYCIQPSENLWWLLLITVAVLTASFYSGLGPMLVLFSVKFLYALK